MLTVAPPVQVVVLTLKLMHPLKQVPLAILQPLMQEALSRVTVRLRVPVVEVAPLNLEVQPLIIIKTVEDLQVKVQAVHQQHN
jgi:hypothetical protein